MTIAAPTPPHQPHATRTGHPVRPLYLIRLIHRGIRRDAAALVTALEQLDPEECAGGHTAAALRDWFVQFAAVVDQHHRLEDRMLWPAVAALRPGFAPQRDGFARTHREIAAAAATVHKALDQLAATAGSRSLCRAASSRARDAADELACLLVGHLDAEEADGLPIAAEALDATRLDALDADARRSVDPGLLTFLGPWLLDHATPAEAVSLIERTPAPIVSLGRTVWRRRYERSARHVRRVRADRPVPSRTADRRGYSGRTLRSHP